MDVRASSKVIHTYITWLPGILTNDPNGSFPTVSDTSIPVRGRTSFSDDCRYGTLESLGRSGRKGQEKEGDVKSKITDFLQMYIGIRKSTSVTNIVYDIMDLQPT